MKRRVSFRTAVQNHVKYMYDNHPGVLILEIVIYSVVMVTLFSPLFPKSNCNIRLFGSCPTTTCKTPSTTKWIYTTEGKRFPDHGPVPTPCPEFLRYKPGREKYLAEYRKQMDREAAEQRTQ